MMTMKSWMNTYADACSAPAYQCACMSTSYAIAMDTAALAVSFFRIKVREVLKLAVRIILPEKANP